MNVFWLALTLSVGQTASPPAETIQAAPATVPAAPAEGAPVSAVASPDNAGKTLLGGNVPMTLDAAVVLRGATASNNLGMMLGVRGNVVANKNVLLGIAGYGTVWGPSVPSQSSSLTALTPYHDRQFVFGYTGLDVGYVFSPDEMIHVELHGLAGVGGVGHRARKGDGEYIGPDGIFVLEPGAEVVIAVLSGIDVALGAGYRWAYGVTLQGVPKNADNRVDALNGFNFDLSVRSSLWQLP